MDTVTIDYKLLGVDKTCTSRDTTISNSCGLHIHSGFSCETDAMVGGHYYDTTKFPEDPWAKGPSYYTVTDTIIGQAKGEVTIRYGYGVDLSKGRAFVLHDRAGVKMACGLLPATTDKVALGRIGKYPEYTGDYGDVKGHIEMTFRGVSVAISYNLIGVDPNCATPNAGIQNSCGVHIHEGMTCSNATEVGGHYYDPTYLPSLQPVPGDPWAKAFYIASGNSAKGMVQVEYGYGFSTSAGRAVVLHDYNGIRVACVLIPAASE